MAEERTTEEERNHIMEARRRVANKRKKVKLTGSKSTETDDDDDEGLIKNQGRMSSLGRVSFFACSLLKRDLCPPIFASSQNAFQSCPPTLKKLLTPLRMLNFISAVRDYLAISFFSIIIIYRNLLVRFEKTFW